MRHQGLLKRSMNHKTAIAFDVTGMGRVVMDPVAVESDGRIAEQHRRRRGNNLVMRAGRRRVRLCRNIPAIRSRRVAINDILAFTDAKLSISAVVMIYGDEAERTGAALPDPDILDRREPCHLGADDQRVPEFDLADGFI